jgi:hypothetical protein
MTAPFGGAEGPPPRIALLPHTRIGGDAGPAATDEGTIGKDAGPGRKDAGPEECGGASASQARPATPAAKQARSVQPMGHLRALELPRRCPNRMV